MDTQTQIERLIELAIVQRTELKQLVEQLPQLREHLNAEIERNLEEIEPQLRFELEEFCDKRAVDANAKVGSALEAKIVELSKALELTTQARFNAIKEQERKVEELRQLAAKQIEGHVAALPEAVKEIVGAELARFPRAGEIDQLRKEFAEPKGLNPRGKWLPSETYNRLDLVTYNGDSFTSAIDGNRSRPSRNAAEWTLIAARGTGGGGPTSLSELTTVPSNGDLLIGSGTSWVTSNLTAGAGISITVGAGEITISATDGDITLDDGTAANPSLHFTNDADTGIYRPAANTLGISVSGTQVAYFDENGLTIPSAGVVAGGSFHAANGNANNPSHSFTSDQDTGFYRHTTNQIGVSTSGTASLIFTNNAGELLGHTGVSVTFGAGSSGATLALGQGTNGGVTITPKGSGTAVIAGTTIPASKTLVVTTDKLSALAATTSSELAGVISDETGTGALVFANTPTLVTPTVSGKITVTNGNVRLSNAYFLSGNLAAGSEVTLIGRNAADKVSIDPDGYGTIIGGNLTVSGQNTYVGVGGTGAADAALRLNGSSATNQGAFVNFSRNSVVKGYLGTSSAVLGGSSDDMILYGTGSAKVYSGSAVAATFDGSQNTTLAGNLTVSGTGTSSVAGNLGVGTTTPARRLDVRVTGTGNVANFQSDSGPNVAFTGTESSGRTYLIGEGLVTAGMFSIYDATASAERLAVTSGGNLLLGTTTDSSNGKLQLANHTDKTGGIGFGTDISLYREASSILTFSTSTHNSFKVLSSAADRQQVVQFVQSGNSAAIAFEGGTRGNYIGITVNGTEPLKVYGGGTALTLDSSQNATFEGKVTVSNGADLLLTNSTYTMRANVNTIVGNPAIWFRDGGSPTSSNYSLSGDGTNTNLNATAGGSVELRVGNGTALKVDSNKNVSIPNGSFGIATSTPASASATGTTGTIAWDASYIYVCTATNTWKRVAIATW